MQFKYKLEGGDFTNAGNASSAVKKILRQLNVDSAIIKRIVVALYEAEVNIVAHAYSGIIDVNIDENKLYICLEDKGPGIPDIEKAMEEGYSTASSKVREMGFGAGMGLANIKRNADRFLISSETGKGTKVELFHNLKQNAE
ncbi:MAG: anti-sigma regulatory factor [Bacteroidales bacterium]|nr:anti-sigma regulatory factor [Bacteroidales bacterium]MCB9013830.1 anti-sigma regulatory factor [Bacteroidales bacterium]